jgi:hypothetical protein
MPQRAGKKNGSSDEARPARAITRRVLERDGPLYERARRFGFREEMLPAGELPSPLHGDGAPGNPVKGALVAGDQGYTIAAMHASKPAVSIPT